MNKKKVPIPKLKRLFDIFFAVVLLVITSPLFILILLAIFIEHILRGCFFTSLFYTDIRISQEQKFKLIKFNIFNPRTIAKMKKKGQFIHTKELEENGDMLLVGRVLKQIYLDEFPQLINVLKGDLSLVGPRPVNSEVYQRQLKQGIFIRSIIKSGITGNFQSQKNIKGKTDVGLESEYIEFCAHNPSWKILLFDIKIILRTLIVMLKAEGV